VNITSKCCFWRIQETPTSQQFETLSR